MTDRGLPPLLDYSLKSMPLVLRGYERNAVDRLFENVSASYTELYRQREELEKNLASAEEVGEDLRKTEQRLTGVIDKLKSDLALAQESEQALKDTLSRLDPELARYRTRELLLTEMLESVKRTAAEIKADARAGATKTLKKANEREAKILRSAARRLESAKKIEAEARPQADKLLADLAKRDTDAAAAAAETFRSAEEDASKVRADALAEATATVEAAKEREAQIIRDAERELAQREAERQDLRSVSNELRDDLSVLISTLGRLETTFEEEGEHGPSSVATAVEEQRKAPPDDQSRHTTDPASLADVIKARVHAKVKPSEESESGVPPSHAPAARASGRTRPKKL